MNKYTLTRAETSPQGTFGRFVVEGISFFSGELPWYDNASNISCIPPGEYTCLWTFSPHFNRKMYGVGPVPNRSGIRKHSANFMGDARLGYRKQLNGCISLGEKLGWIGGQKAILLSSPAIRRFETMMAGRPFLLEVKSWE